MWKRRAAGLAVLSCAASLVACSDDVGRDESPETEPIDDSRQEILGGVGSTDCNVAQRTALRHALLLGRARVLSKAFDACMEEIVTKRPYVPCTTSVGQTHGVLIDPPLAANPESAAVAAAVARSANGTRITCADLQKNAEVSSLTRGLTLWTDMHTLDHRKTEELSLDTNDFLDRATDLQISDLAVVANTIWHEVFHTHGFWHDSSGLECQDQSLYESMPVIGGDCVGAMSAPCEDQSHCPEGGTIAFGRFSNFGDCECVTIFGGSEPPCPHTSSFPDCDPSVKFIGPATPIRDINEEGDAFGAALVAGDFDGDGFDDLAVGVPGEDGGNGAVDVYFGTKFGLIPILRLSGSPRSHFGSALAAADFDGDALADLAIGSPGFLRSRGLVAVLRGSDAAFGVSSGLRYLPRDRRHLFGRRAGDRFGSSLVAGRGVAGSGLAMLAVGLPGANRRSGAVQVFVNGSAPDGEFQLALEVAAPEQDSGARFGFALSPTTTDATTSTIDSLLVGAPRANGGRGRAYLVSLVPPLTSTWQAPSLAGFPGPIVASASPDTLSDRARFGATVAIGALGTGSPTAIAGAPGQDSIYFFEASAKSMSDGQSSQRSAGRGSVGSGISSAPGGSMPSGDVVFVGTPWARGGFVDVWIREPERRRLIVSQRIDQFALSDNATGDEFGVAFATGDFDGDGRLDLAVGAPGERVRGDGARSGAVYLFSMDDRDICAEFLPAKVLTQEGGVEEQVRPLTHWKLSRHYEIGDRVRHDCQNFEARGEPSGQPPAEDPNAWSPIIPAVVKSADGEISEARHQVR